MRQNKYNGIESIHNLKRGELKVLLSIILKYKVNSDFKLSYFTEEDNNMFDEMIYNSFILIKHKYNTKELNKIVREFITNYLINCYFYNNKYNVFNEIFEEKYIVEYITGMTLVDLRLSNQTLSRYLFDVNLLFIECNTISSTYKNYHLTINDVIKEREKHGLKTILLFDGTNNNIKEYEYDYLCPKIIDFNNKNNKTKTNNENKKTSSTFDALLD